MTLTNCLKTLIKRQEWISKQIDILVQHQANTVAVHRYRNELVALDIAVRCIEVMISYGYSRVGADGPFREEDENFTSPNSPGHYYPGFTKWRYHAEATKENDAVAEVEADTEGSH